MPPRGKFTDADTSEPVDVVQQTVLRSGVGRLLRRIDGVVIRPVSADQVPNATISRPGLVGKAPRIVVEPPLDMTPEQAQSIIAAADIDGPQARRSSGHCIYDFAADSSGAQLVGFALAALRAIGGQAVNDRWEYEGVEPEGA
jgi:hypothetical protein